MTQCRVIGIEWPNWEPLNYILFSVYREDIRKLEEENNNLKNELMEDMKTETKLNERIRFLEQCLDNKEKVNISLREENKKLEERIEELETDYDRLKVAFEDVVSWK